MMKNKKSVVAFGLVPGMAVTAMPVLASEAGGTANQAVVSAMTSVANDMTATGTALLPVALGVIGLILVVTFGIKIFKSVAKK